MSITEDERHQLHEGFIEVLGRKRAATVMAMLPPVGWADVMTKRDGDQLYDRIDAKLERELRALENRFLNKLVLVAGAFFTAQTAVFQLLR